MAISKLILNGETQMDVTSNTNVASNMLNGVIGTKNDGTQVTGNIASKSSSDLTASGATVTAPAGYYSASASKSVTTMTLPTTTSTGATSGYTLKATLDRSTSDRYLNIAPGYNSSGGYYKINKVANGSVTAPNSISGTSATVSTGTNTLTLTKSVSVTPNVTTAGYISSGTAGNSSVSLTASVTTKGAATITPSTSEQSVAAGTYLTGKLTISAMPSGTAGTPTATKGTVSNNSISVTPSVTNTTGYITGGTKTGTAVTVSASELVSGTKSITENGTGVDVTNYASVDVDVAVTANIVPLTVNSSSEEQTFYSDGNVYKILGSGAQTSMASTNTYTIIEGVDTSNIKPYTPYKANGSLRIVDTYTGNTTYIQIDGITYSDLGENQSLSICCPMPFTYTGSNILSRTYVRGTQQIYFSFLESSQYNVELTSDITLKEVGNRESIISATPSTYNAAISYDSAGLSSGDLISISGMYRGSDRNGRVTCTEVFDEQFVWDGNTHTFNIPSAGTAIAYVTLTTSTIQCTAIETASRSRHFGVNLSKYSSADGYNPVVVSRDFSTATLTITNNNSFSLSAFGIPIVVEAEELGSGAPAMIYTWTDVPSGTSSYTVPLYKGSMNFMNYFYQSVDGNRVFYQTTLSGNAQLVWEGITVTGDSTITILTSTIGGSNV